MENDLNARTTASPLCKSNDTPSPEDALYASNIVGEGIIEIQNLDAQISKTKELLSQLVSQRERLVAYVDAHKSVLSPVRRLPPEILTLIFLHISSPIRVDQPDLFPWNVTRVSAFWRSVMLSTKEVWSSLSVNLKRMNCRRAIKQLNACIDRSGDRSLSIQIFFPSPASTRMNGVDEIIQILRSCSLRWYSVAVEERFQHHYTPKLFSLSGEGFPLNLSNLRTLSLTLPAYPSHPLPQRTFENAPKLSSLLLDVDLRESLQDMFLPWSQITRLNLTTQSPDYDHLLNCLAETSRLEYLRISGLFSLLGDGIHPPHYGLVELPKLRSLKFDCLRTDHLPRILPALITPSLVELNIRMEKESTNLRDLIPDYLRRVGYLGRPLVQLTVEGLSGGAIIALSKEGI